MKTLFEMKDALEKNQTTSVELVEECLGNIGKTDSQLGSFLSINARAIEIAKKSDKEKSKRPLEGLPIAIKDMIVTKDIKTTAASKILENYIPPYSATLVERLEKAGAIVIGKNNLDEFAMGSSNETSAFKPCKNPWDFEKVPGGSSGGSAAAVAAGLVPASIGTDTGGSVRQPASFCGVVGMKPTYGRISRFGVIAYASSLDQAGPITHTVEDAALLYEVMAGPDGKDATLSEKEVSHWSRSDFSVKGKKIGLLKPGLSDAVDEEIKNEVQKAKEFFASAGADVIEVDLPSFDLVVPTYYLIAMSEASSNLARYDGVRYGLRAESENLEQLYVESRSQGFGAEVKRRLLLGTFALSSGYRDEYYLQACKVRRKIFNEYQAVFSNCDVLLSPVAATTAFTAGDKIKDPMQMYLNDIFTASVNLAGLPAISLPSSLSKAGLPIGVQLIAPSFEESRLFDYANFLESQLGWKREVPHGLR